MCVELKTEDVNVLIHGYLLEVGYTHTAHSFMHEANIDKSRLRLPHGALITFLQKSLLYVWMEAHVDKDGNEQPCSAPFTLFKSHKCTKATDKTPDPFIAYRAQNNNNNNQNNQNNQNNNDGGPGGPNGTGKYSRQGGAQRRQGSNEGTGAGGGGGGAGVSTTSQQQANGPPSTSRGKRGFGGVVGGDDDHETAMRDGDAGRGRGRGKDRDDPDHDVDVDDRRPSKSPGVPGYGFKAPPPKKARTEVGRVPSDEPAAGKAAKAHASKAARQQHQLQKEGEQQHGGADGAAVAHVPPVVRAKPPGRPPHASAVEHPLVRPPVLPTAVHQPPAPMAPIQPTGTPSATPTPTLAPAPPSVLMVSQHLPGVPPRATMSGLEHIILTQTRGAKAMGVSVAVTPAAGNTPDTAEFVWGDRSTLAVMWNGGKVRTDTDENGARRVEFHQLPPGSGQGAIPASQCTRSVELLDEDHTNLKLLGDATPFLFSDDLSSLIVFHDDGAVTYGLHGACVHRLKTPASGVFGDAKVSPSGRYLIMTGENNVVWNVKDGQQRQSFQCLVDENEVAQIVDDSQNSEELCCDVWRACWATDQLLALIPDTGTVFLVSMDGGRPVRIKANHTYDVPMELSCLEDMDGKWLSQGGERYFVTHSTSMSLNHAPVKVWRVKGDLELDLVVQLPAADVGVPVVQWVTQKDGNATPRLVTSHLDVGISVWEIDPLKKEATKIHQLDTGPHVLAVSHDGRVAAVASGAHIAVVSCTDWRVLSWSEVDGKEVKMMRWSNEGRRLACVVLRSEELGAYMAVIDIHVNEEPEEGEVEVPQQLMQPLAAATAAASAMNGDTAMDTQGAPSPDQEMRDATCADDNDNDTGQPRGGDAAEGGGGVVGQQAACMS
ncbi:unnamed protein product [Vitrella brassicaformis CCMP3155]|uniref:Uncharacterized protein n=2 Tax=Vitrella brassicaformis TaxID=1169539 RepID=A0A0G4EES3_VITBC|nr:unnamed protein product [Vitrella brassicaformis CCMP3155]|eukprot:CEL94044.1 unnamed protein product [Vitrella brassicaformis CCMP3155]